MMETSYDLPEEIWYEILERVPLKSLGHFLLVSKRFHILVTSQSFISSHLTRNITTQSNTHLLLKAFRYVSRVWAQQFLFYPHLEEHNNSTHKYFGIPYLKPKPPTIIRDISRYEILGSCNGLICLMNTFYIILWNPSIKKYVELPQFSTSISIRSSRVRWFVFGFGVNLLDGDFKVVRVIKTFSCPDSPPLVDVYSLKARKWVEIEINIVSHNPLFLSSSPQVYMNGCSHWINKLAGNETPCSIVSFNMSDEVFREVTLPKQVAKIIVGLDKCQYSKFVKLVTMNFRETQCLGIVIDRLKSIDIWVMKDYGVLDSWTNIYNIDTRLDCLRFAGFMSNGNVLLSGNQGHLVVYDHLGKLVCKLPDTFGEYVDKYVESLILL